MDLTQEEINMVLEAGLEKVAYEEGLNDYANSLEKVANVHGVDAMELHDFLEDAGQMEKEAEELNEGAKQKMKQNLSRIQSLGLGAAGAGTGAVLGSNYGTKGAVGGAAAGGLAGGLAGRYLTNRGFDQGQEAIQKMLNDDSVSDKQKQKIIEGIKKQNEKYGKNKTASAYGLDEDTFDALFNAGVEALTE